MFSRWDELDDAIGQRRFADALRLTVDAWRESRAPELGELVDVIARSITSPPPTNADGWRTSSLWLEAAKEPDPVAFGGVLASLDRDLPIRGTFYGGGEAQSIATWNGRITALGARDPDPRTAPRVTRSLTELPIWMILRFEHVVPLLVALADIRVVPTLRAFARMNSHIDLDSALTRCASAIERAVYDVPPLDEDRAATVRSWTARLTAESLAIHRRSNELLEAILADPDDEAARAVHRDVLLETDDPRGTVLALQLDARPRTALARKKRIDGLIAAHEESWIGGLLIRVLARRVYRLGFLEEAALEARIATTDQGWLDAARDPRLATLRRLEIGWATAAEYVAFLRAPALRGVTTIEGTSPILEELAHHTFPRVENVELRFATDERTLFTHLDACAAALPALRKITIRSLPYSGVGSFERALASKTFARLDELTIDEPLDTYHQLPRVVEIANRARVVPRLVLTTHHATITIVWPDRAGRPSAIVETDNGIGLAPLASLTPLARLTFRPRSPDSVRRLLKPGVITTRIDRLAPAEVDIPEEWSKQLRRRVGP